MTKPIKIAQRFRPFSHIPGSSFIVPGSSYELEIFPALVRLWDISKADRIRVGEIALNIQGPLKEFTMEVDLDRDWIKVWGKGTQGFLRYRCQSYQKEIIFYFEKCPKDIDINVICTLPFYQKENQIVVETNKAVASPEKELLTLGSNKQLNWEKVKERLNFTEIFPSWFLLGQTLLDFYKVTPKESFPAISLCNEAIEKRPEHILESFIPFFLAHFKGVLVPQYIDPLNQGIIKESMSLKESPLSLLTEGAKLIRRLFIEQQGSIVRILPHLPPQFFSGRMLHLNLAPLGKLDIEWTKKKMRRATFYSQSDGQVQFCFPSSLKKFRLRTNFKEKGEILSCGTPFLSEASQIYYLDRFEH